MEVVDSDIARIVMDIQDNLETVYSIDEEMYGMVVGQYKRQKEKFKNIMGQLVVTPIQMRTIQF